MGTRAKKTALRSGRSHTTVTPKARTIKQWSDTPITAMVPEAMPIARSIVAAGLGGQDESDCGAGFNVTAHVERLLGIDMLDETLPEEGEALDAAMVAYQAAFAIGIATGLLLRPEAFQAAADSTDKHGANR